MQELEDIVFKVQNSLVPARDAIREITRIIYLNRPLFGIHRLNEDKLHEFIIYEMENMDRLFKVYNRELGSFTSFLIGNIRCNLITWEKSCLTGDYSRQCTFHAAYEEYEDKAYSYNRNEFSSQIKTTDWDPEQEELEHYMILLDKKLKEWSKGTEAQQNMSQKIKREQELKKEALLILTLKSSFYLTDSIIKKTSMITGISVDEILKMKEKLMEQMEAKIKKRDRFLTARDRSYFYKTRFQLECNAPGPGGSWTELVTGKYQKQKQRWERQNSIIQSGKLSIVPSHRSIARLLNISERRIYYVMKRLEKNMDRISLKGYSIDHENLFGNRKPEQKKRNGRNSLGL